MDPKPKEPTLARPDPVGTDKPPQDASDLTVKVEGLHWSGPLQQGCIEADPFVMWVAVTFVTIITILYFFLRGVKRPSSRNRRQD